MTDWSSMWRAPLRLVLPTSSIGSSTFRRTLLLQPGAQVTTLLFFCCFFWRKIWLMEEILQPAVILYIKSYETLIKYSQYQPDGSLLNIDGSPGSPWGQTETRCLWRQESCKAAWVPGVRLIKVPGFGCWNSAYGMWCLRLGLDV